MIGLLKKEYFLFFLSFFFIEELNLVIKLD